MNPEEMATLSTLLEASPLLAVILAIAYGRNPFDKLTDAVSKLQIAITKQTTLLESIERRMQ